MSHVFEASIRGDSGCFIYVSVKKGDRDRAGRERTLFILFVSVCHINIASSELVKHTVYNRSEYTHVASLLIT